MWSEHIVTRCLESNQWSSNFHFPLIRFFKRTNFWPFAYHMIVRALPWVSKGTKARHRQTCHMSVACEQPKSTKGKIIKSTAHWNKNCIAILTTDKTETDKKGKVNLSGNTGSHVGWRMYKQRHMASDTVSQGWVMSCVMCHMSCVTLPLTWQPWIGGLDNHARISLPRSRFVPWNNRENRYVTNCGEDFAGILISRNGKKRQVFRPDLKVRKSFQPGFTNLSRKTCW